jgi:hypothetical protein
MPGECDGQRRVVAHVWIRSIRNHVGSEHDGHSSAGRDGGDGQQLQRGDKKINGASYDAFGNLVSYTGSALTHGAENRITSATQSGIGSMYYFYDGAGQRVQEVSTYNTEKVFVYDVFGHL